MKKLMSFLLVLVVLFTCCACGEKETTATTAPTVESTEELPGAQLLTPEDLYGHIDQSGPIDGVFQIWSAEGVRNMSKYPDAKFEVLCNIDAQGVEITPLGTVEKPFTGRFNGANFTISNITIKGGEDGAFGMFGVNKGTIENFYAENVSFLVDGKAKNVGTIAGINEGTIKRSSLTGGGMEFAQMPEGANCGSIVGKNVGTMQVVESEVDLTYTAATKANVGGIAGLAEGGKIEYCKSRGALKTTGGNANIGLYAGTAKDVTFTGCVFLGAENSVDGKLFTNFAGTEENVTYPDCLLRDNDIEPMPENVAHVRDLVVQQMRDMADVEWHVKEDLVHTCKCGTSGTCDGTYLAGWTYYGLPYKHGNGSLTSIKYMIGDDGYLDDWVYDMPSRNGYDSYMGAMCSSASQMAWWRVSNSVDHMQCVYMLPDFPEYGCIPVGTGWYENDVPNSRYDTINYINSCSEQTFYEALAEVHRGDCLVQGIEIGDHVIMADSEPVVVRDVEGNIDPNESYIHTLECSGSTVDAEAKTYTSWKRKQRSFSNVRGETFVPITIEELLTGEMEPGECTILDGADGKRGMTKGTVKGNYFLESVTMKITDEEGNVILDKVMFPKAGKFNRGNVRVTSIAYIDYFDLAQFAVVLQDIMFEPGKTYSYTISAHLACDEDFVLKTDSFVQGQAD